MITSTHLPLFIAAAPEKIRKIYRKNSHNNLNPFTASPLIRVYQYFQTIFVIVVRLVNPDNSIIFNVKC